VKLKSIEHQVGARPPDDADEYVKRESHPVLRATRDKANELASYSWSANRVTTTDATQTLVTSHTVGADETVRIHVRAVGFVAGHDSVIEEWDITYSMNNGVLAKEHVNLLSGPIYSPYSTLSSACADLVETDDRIELKVTGEANTEITWIPYCQVQEVTWALNP